MGRYGCWLGGILFLLTVVIVAVMNLGDLTRAEPLSWSYVMGLLGTGISTMLIALHLLLAPMDVLGLLNKLVPWWHPPAWSIRFFGFFLSLSGVLEMLIGISTAFELLRAGKSIS